jgi:hypothetical protein
MKKNNQSWLKKLILGLFLGLTACNGGGESTMDKMSKAPTEESAAVKPEADATKPLADTTYGVSRHNLDQTGRKFIRTGEMRFEVKNVQKAIQTVEDLCIHYQGFITYSNTKSQIKHTQSYPLSADSLVEVKTYGIESEVHLRVPNQKLDSLLRNLNSLIHFLDYRLVQAEDASLKLMANELKNNRLQNYEKRVINAIDNKGQNLNDIQYANDNLLNRQNQADENKIQNLFLEDQINYSTLKLFLYQRDNHQKEIIANPFDFEKYQPTLGQRLADGFMKGIKVLEEILVVVAHLWVIILGSILAWLVWIKWRRGL